MGRVLAEPWGSPYSPLKDGLLSLLGDNTAWHSPGEGMYLSVWGPLHFPHVPVRSLWPAASPRPLGTPNLSLNLPFLLPNPLQPARLYDATASPLLGAGGFSETIPIYARAEAGPYWVHIYCAGCNRVAEQGWGPGSSPSLGRAGTRHTQ